MAKYDWIALEKEYILSDYKSVSAFLKDKNISMNGSTKNKTKGWKNKKVLKENEKSTKIIEKVIEKESTKEANKIIKINDVATNLLKKVMEATNELNIHMDMFGKQHKGIVDRSDIKKLTSALKDLKEIIPDKTVEEEDNSFVEALNGKVEDVWNEKEE